MYHILLAFISIAICYKFGNWRNWKKYYPTILFFILSNLACVILIYNHQLWAYESKILGHTFADLLICVTVYPSTVMMFIPHLPSKPIKSIKKLKTY